MAAENPMESLQEEVTYPICLEYLTEPVTLECGDNFCRACVTQCWQGSDTDFSCPQCRETVQQRNLKLNRLLANVLEIVKQLNLHKAKGAGGDGVCGEHQKPLKLFCEEDQTPICVLCDRSQAHRAHTVVLIEEAAQEYKKKIQTHLKTLRKEREKLLRLNVIVKNRIQEYLQLRQFLEEQERLLLAQLEKLDKKVVKIQNESTTKCSEEISRLSELISEMEGKCQKPGSEFLQDVRSTLSRYCSSFSLPFTLHNAGKVLGDHVKTSSSQGSTAKCVGCEKGKFQQPAEISLELEKSLSDFAQKTIALMETLRKVKDILPVELEGKKENTLGSHRQVNVTLDPDTAHPELLLSEGQKSVRWGDKWHRLPNNPKRFDTLECVLGCEGFTSGRYYWEVEVGGEIIWAVGVARESVRRKGLICFNPEWGIWAVAQWWGEFQALTSPKTPLPLSWVPRRIRVCLDYEQGLVTFLDADNDAPIFTFPPASFSGERIHPWLWVQSEQSQLRLCP
ncbi:zinc finger protein RFP-like isoform X2 [Trachemys scripta elegans]|uniref:zinc finger protein RFP-like isoform X2 n=1 Tax=Trachemys scripta elegans TaxID=31138 RepID=UPI001555BD22|nr:zinc finger protein RFP-like isoform X2 [Trachemys scripta elegans]